jgi:hypothetical protein
MTFYLIFEIILLWELWWLWVNYIFKFSENQGWIILFLKKLIEIFYERNKKDHANSWFYFLLNNRIRTSKFFLIFQYFKMFLHLIEIIQKITFKIPSLATLNLNHSSFLAFLLFLRSRCKMWIWACEKVENIMLFS